MLSRGVHPVKFSDLESVRAMIALTGLVLVAWSASFAFLQMQRHWKQE